MSDVFTGWVGLLFVLFCLAVGILWIILPFAVFGIKSRLDALLAEQRKTNAALTNISQQIHVVAEAYLRTPATPGQLPPRE